MNSKPVDGEAVFRWGAGITDTEKAFEEGKIAASNGEKQSTNPYDAMAQTELHGAWNAGFEYAGGHDDDDEPTDG